MLTALLLAAALAPTFHPLAIGELATEDAGRWRRMRTHVEVAGFVTYARREEDGDLHLRLCDSPRVWGMNRARCIVAECIPALPCRAPRPGSRVRVRGISRYDAERGHRWWEVHPVLSLEAVR